MRERINGGRGVCTATECIRSCCVTAQPYGYKLLLEAIQSRLVVTGRVRPKCPGCVFITRKAHSACEWGIGALAICSECAESRIKQGKSEWGTGAHVGHGCPICLVP